MASNTFFFETGAKQQPPPPDPRPDGTTPRLYRGKPIKEVASEKLAKWPPDEPQQGADELLLMNVTEDTILRLLTSDIDAKTMCGVVANAVRLLQVKAKVKVDDEPESFFGGGDG